MASTPAAQRRALSLLALTTASAAVAHAAIAATHMTV
jgi:hypothetical protein